MNKFRVIQSKREISENGFYLIPDNWDDWFEYEISYHLWIKENETEYVGRVKIAEKNQSIRKATIESEFVTLNENYVSIGFNEDYYEELKKTKYREQILVALNDIAFDLKIYEQVQNYHVTKVALLREYSESMLKGQIHRMALGGARLTNYDFTYVFPSINPITGEKVKISFEVVRNKKPSSNIHVMIGKNGIGKTTIIKKIIYALEKCKGVEEVGEVESNGDTNFSNIVFVSFSAFDEPIFEENFADKFPIQYKFVGLVKNKSIKSRDTLTEEFVDCSFSFYQNASKMRLWKETIKILESDNTFVEQEIDTWINETIKKEWISLLIKTNEIDAESRGEKIKEKHRQRVFPLYSRLSSGHKIILLTIANLIDLVEEKTIVFLDEPEEHLHPPLVAAFIKALSNLLIYRNGVGIIATHSPVIVQEVPKKCVWILKRTGEYLIPRRPEIETYGENLGELTTEIFRYEVSNSGFHKEILDVVNKCSSYEEAKAVFGNQLGKEAKSILRVYMYDKEEQIEE